jgi:hypothetical protein
MFCQRNNILPQHLAIKYSPSLHYVCVPQFSQDANNPDAPKNPADMPPPTTMGPGPAMSSGPPGGGPPGASGPSASNGGDTYDPLAALMAPPSRVYGAAPAAPAADSGDPLAALMAPPPVRIPASGSSGNLPGAGRGAPPSIASGAAGPPRFWTPPAVSSSTANPAPSSGGSTGAGAAPGFFSAPPGAFGGGVDLSAPLNEQSVDQAPGAAGLGGPPVGMGAAPTGPGAFPPPPTF